MNTRRSFLGQILGTIVVSQLPFIGEQQKLRQYNKLILSDDDLRHLHGFYRLGNTEIIKTTKLLGAKVEGTTVTWKFEDWEATKIITLNKMGLCLPDGTIYKEEFFNSGSQTLYPGDTLKGTISLSL